MFLSQALDHLQSFSPEQFKSLSDYLSPGIINDCLANSGVATIRKRRLPLELMIWSVVGMTIFRHIPMSQIVNQLDIVPPGKRPYVAPSAVVQARQRLGIEAVKDVFEQTQALWCKSLPISNWCGLRLLGVDGIVWRTPDTPENSHKFARTSNAQSPSLYPQVRMVCQMELSSHLITASSFDSVSKNEMLLAADLIEKTPDNSLTIFDKGFYSLGLLHKWQTSGTERHWLLPLNKGRIIKVVRKISSNDAIVELASCPQARKKWPHLPENITARYLERNINGKKYQILTSMIDLQKYRLFPVT